MSQGTSLKDTLPDKVLSVLWDLHEHKGRSVSEITHLIRSKDVADEYKNAKNFPMWVRCGCLRLISRGLMLKHCRKYLLRYDQILSNNAIELSPTDRYLSCRQCNGSQVCTESSVPIREIESARNGSTSESNESGFNSSSCFLESLKLNRKGSNRITSVNEQFVAMNSNNCSLQISSVKQRIRRSQKVLLNDGMSRYFQSNDNDGRLRNRRSSSVARETEADGKQKHAKTAPLPSDSCKLNGPQNSVTSDHKDHFNSKQMENSKLGQKATAEKIELKCSNGELNKCSSNFRKKMKLRSSAKHVQLKHYALSLRRQNIDALSRYRSVVKRNKLVKSKVSNFNMKSNRGNNIDTAKDSSDGMLGIDTKCSKLMASPCVSDGSNTSYKKTCSDVSKSQDVFTETGNSEPHVKALMINENKMPQRTSPRCKTGYNANSPKAKSCILSAHIGSKRPRKVIVDKENNFEINGICNEAQKSIPGAGVRQVKSPEKQPEDYTSDHMKQSTEEKLRIPKSRNRRTQAKLLNDGMTRYFLSTGRKRRNMRSVANAKGNSSNNSFLSNSVVVARSNRGILNQTFGNKQRMVSVSRKRKLLNCSTDGKPTNKRQKTENGSHDVEVSLNVPQENAETSSVDAISKASASTTGLSGDANKEQLKSKKGRPRKICKASTCTPKEVFTSPETSEEVKSVKRSRKTSDVRASENICAVDPKSVERHSYADVSSATVNSDRELPSSAVALTSSVLSASESILFPHITDEDVRWFFMAQSIARQRRLQSSKLTSEGKKETSNVTSQRAFRNSASGCLTSEESVDAESVASTNLHIPEIFKIFIADKDSDAKTRSKGSNAKLQKLNNINKSASESSINESSSRDSRAESADVIWNQDQNESSSEENSDGRVLRHDLGSVNSSKYNTIDKSSKGAVKNNSFHSCKENTGVLPVNNEFCNRPIFRFGRDLLDSSSDCEDKIEPLQSRRTSSVTQPIVRSDNLNSSMQQHNNNIVRPLSANVPVDFLTNSKTVSTSDSLDKHLCQKAIDNTTHNLFSTEKILTAKTCIESVGNHNQAITSTSSSRQYGDIIKKPVLNFLPGIYSGMPHPVMSNSVFGCNRQLKDCNLPLWKGMTPSSSPLKVTPSLKFTPPVKFTPEGRLPFGTSEVTQHQTGPGSYTTAVEDCRVGRKGSGLDPVITHTSVAGLGNGYQSLLSANSGNLNNNFVEKLPISLATNAEQVRLFHVETAANSGNCAFSERTFSNTVTSNHNDSSNLSFYQQYTDGCLPSTEFETRIPKNVQYVNNTPELARSVWNGMPAVVSINNSYPINSVRHGISVQGVTASVSTPNFKSGGGRSQTNESYNVQSLLSHMSYRTPIAHPVANPGNNTSYTHSSPSGGATPSGAARAHPNSVIQPTSILSPTHRMPLQPYCVLLSGTTAGTLSGINLSGGMVPLVPLNSGVPGVTMYPAEWLHQFVMPQWAATQSVDNCEQNYSLNSGD